MSNIVVRVVIPAGCFAALSLVVLGISATAVDQKDKHVEIVATEATSNTKYLLNGHDPASVSATDYTLLNSETTNGVKYSTYFRRANPEKLPPAERNSPCVEVSVQIDAVPRSNHYSRVLNAVDQTVDENKAKHNKLEYYCIRPDGYYAQVDFYANPAPAS